MTKTALIIGAGKGISGSFAKELASEGYKVCLASRNLQNIASIASDISGFAVTVDVSSEESIRNLFKKFQKMLEILRVPYQPGNPYERRSSYIVKLLSMHSPTKEGKLLKFYAFTVGEPSSRDRAAVAAP